MDRNEAWVRFASALAPICFAQRGPIEWSSFAASLADAMMVEFESRQSRQTDRGEASLLEALVAELETVATDNEAPVDTMRRVLHFFPGKRK